MASNETATSQGEPSLPDLDSSRTARHIYALGDVEKDIARLLELAALAVSHLTLPLTDDENDKIPKDNERAEAFVEHVQEYYRRLNSIQYAIRSSLAHMRQSRIPPSAIDAPAHNFRPRPPGVGLPPLTREETATEPKTRGLQEERLDRDAWQGILDALTRIRDLRAQERAASEAAARDETGDVSMG